MGNRERNKVLLVDAATGNLRSVQHALQAVGAEVEVTADPEVVRRGGRIILPGVGAFASFMDGLRERGLVEALLEAAGRGDPLLGICVGMQALFEVSEEMGTHPGLGICRGCVQRFDETPGLKIPHTGWNQVWGRRSSGMLSGLKPGAYAYFNHSYYCAPLDPGDVLASTEYGQSFAAMVQRENLVGIQFHPEKSQRVGQQILANFLAWEGEARG